MALDMNPEIRAQWTAALRSGLYMQGTNALRLGEAFCCLGVLCDLGVQAGIATASDDEECAWSYDGLPDLLPESVAEWAGLGSCNPEVVVDDREPDGSPTRMELSSLNDDEHWDFARIADAIDGGASPGGSRS